MSAMRAAIQRGGEEIDPQSIAEPTLKLVAILIETTSSNDVVWTAREMSRRTSGTDGAWTA